MAAVVDVLRRPRLARQTDFIQKVAARPAGEREEGQFMAPGDMKRRRQAEEANGGADTIMVCERARELGYNNLVSDMRSLAIMRDTGCPVVSTPRIRCEVAWRLGHLQRRRAAVCADPGRAAIALLECRACSWRRIHARHRVVRWTKRVAAAPHESFARADAGD